MRAVQSSLFAESKRLFLKPQKEFFFMRKIFSEQKAQISIELIIVLAAVVALVLLFVSQLKETSSDGTKVIDKKTKEIFDEIDKI